MWISKVKLKNIRGFEDSGDINFSKKINILTGANNSGKSTILKSVYLIQSYDSLNENDITLTKDNGKIEISFEEPFDSLYKNNALDLTKHNKTLEVYLKKTTPSKIEKYLQPKDPQELNIAPNKNPNMTMFAGIPTLQPKHLIFPHLAKRKSTNYQEVINSQTTGNIEDTYRLLYPKIDKLITGLPATRAQFYKICENILQTPISTSALTQHGKMAVISVTDDLSIPITAMGEGTVSLLGLIVDLCVAKNQVFIIEEPENDIHPTALKALLALIEEKSANNQFFISTHSNIVLRYLGGNSKTITYKTSMVLQENMPISSIKLLETPEEKWQALEELGYELYDYNLSSAWLILEEASAEIIIRDILIPYCVKGLLGKLRTFSARSSSEIILKFADFNRLFVFLHLEPIYKNKVWVIIDGGNEEEQIINELKELYVKKNKWKKEHFKQFQEHDFEKYYPSDFQGEVNEVLKITDKKEARNRKKQLVGKVLKWAKKNPEKAKKEFEKSAKEIIIILKSIEKTINS
jgi:AAA15 family ATPase/GTPase